MRKSAEAHNQVRFTTSGGLKTVKQLSRIRTTKTKDYELSVSTLFEFENQTLVDTECILISSPSLWHLDDFKEYII